jgi:hypothetical protein
MSIGARAILFLVSLIVPAAAFSAAGQNTIEADGRIWQDQATAAGWNLQFVYEGTSCRLRFTR